MACTARSESLVSASIMTRGSIWWTKGDDYISSMFDFDPSLHVDMLSTN